MPSVTIRRAAPRLRLVVAVALVGWCTTVVPAAALASAPGHPSHAAFVDGSGGAAAAVFGINVPYAGANFGFAAGTTAANFFDTSADTTAQTFNPEFVNLITALKLCNTAFPLPLPAPTSADTNSTRKYRIASHHAYVDNQGGSFGNETASATRAPSGTAVASLSRLALGSLVSVQGGAASSTVRISTSQLTRTATATSRIGDLRAAGGAIRLTGLRWSLTERTAGVDSRTSRTTYRSTFSMGELQVGALDFHTPTVSQMHRGAAAMDALTKPLGFQIVLPKLTRTVGGEQYTPLQLAFGGKVFYGAPLSNLLVGPHGSLLSLLDESGTTIFDPSTCKELAGVLGAVPSVNYAWNFVGIALPIVLQAMASAFSGGATVEVNVGGVTTSIDDTYYPPPASTGGSSPAGQSSSPAPSGTQAAPTSTAVATRTRAVSSAPAASRPSIASPAALVRYLCRSTSPAGGGCLHDRSALAAIITAGIGGAVFVTDEVRRRRRRSAPGGN